MKITTQVFKENDLKLIHDKSIELLEKTGVYVKSKTALDILKKAGAKVDEDLQIAYISEELVEKALASAPKSYTLGARNPNYDFEMPSKWTGHILAGITTSFVDLETGQTRPSTKNDVYTAGRVFQAMNRGAVAWSGCSALDMPPETHCLHEFAAILRGTSKHIQLELSHKGEAKYVVDILRTVLKSDSEIKNRKIVSVLYCPVSPLSHDKGMLDAYLELSEFDVPVNIYPCPIIGFTSPATLFTTLCQTNAEVLSAFVIFQSARPGRPMIYGTCSGMPNPISGSYATGAETILLSMGAIELAKFYNLPSIVPCGGTYEFIPMYMEDADLVESYATRNGSMTTDVFLMVIQNEVANRVNRLVKGINVSEETDLLGELKTQGPCGGFVGCKSTIKMFRDSDELYFSKLFHDELRDAYGEESEARVIAKDYVSQLLKQPVEDELEPNVLKKIDELCAKADKELKSKQRA